MQATAGVPGSTTDTDDDAYLALQMDIDQDEIEETAAPKVSKRRRERGALSTEISDQAAQIGLEGFQPDIDMEVELQVVKAPIADRKRKAVIQDVVP